MSPRPQKETERQPFLDKYTDSSPEEDSPQLPHHYQLALSRRHRIISHALVFLLTSFLWLPILYLQSHPPSFLSSGLSKPGNPRHNVTSNAHLLTCGNSSTQAREAGCEYDILLNNWVPQPCYDTEFILDYTDDESWGAYSSPDLSPSSRLTPQQMSEAEFYYTSVRDHINHCGILWKKQFWVLFEERRAVDTVVASQGHTDHCAQYLMDVEGGVGVEEATRVERGFAGCWVRD